MPKFKLNFLSIVLLLILLAHPTSIFASEPLAEMAHMDIQSIKERINQIEEKLRQLSNTMELLQKSMIDEVVKNQMETYCREEIKNLLEENERLKRLLVELIGRLTPNPIQPIKPNPIVQPTNTHTEDRRILAKNRIWNWDQNFEFITITIEPRVKIHAQPNVHVPNAPNNPVWTEHEDILLSVFDVKPGPGSTRGWGLLQSYRHTRNGWVNLDDATILWSIRKHNGEWIRFWHWENGVETPNSDAYIIKN